MISTVARFRRWFSGYNSGLLVILLASLNLAACSKTDPLINATCESARSWLELDKAQVERCRQDSGYRAGVKRQRDERLADDLTRSHNANRGILQPAKPIPDAMPIQRLSELPVSTVSSEKDPTLVGKRFVAHGRLQVWSTNRSEPPTLFVYSLNGHGKDGPATIATDALNNYQLTFLRQHCWGLDATSLCEGKIFIELLLDPTIGFVTPEMVGAELGPGSKERVLEAFQR